MIKVEKLHYDKIYNLYLKSKAKFFFPLIAAVLVDEQDGSVFTDNNESPTQAYVEHAFGFSQIFGDSVPQFELELAHYLTESKDFTPDKIRLYTPNLPQFLNLSKYSEYRSTRQRFTIAPDKLIAHQNTNPELEQNITLHRVDGKNISAIEDNFALVERFWRSKTDFIQKSNASVVYYKGEPASICYSAATANHCAEIDVLTLPNYRNLSLAKLAVHDFIKRCFDLSIQPLWDCFTNNRGSMQLCKSIGFSASQAPYPFFTLTKH